MSGAAALPGSDVFQSSDCFKNITSTISKHALSESLGARFAEQNLGNLKNCTFKSSGIPVRRTQPRKCQECTFRNSGSPVRRTRRRKISKIELSRVMGLLCAEQSVGNLKTCTFINPGNPVRRTNRRKYQKNFRDSGTPVRTT